ncbi:MAG: gliding motility-associated C-terminal domain-containing protein [Bacteroidota bacterium]
MAALCQTVPAVPTWVSGMGGAGGNAISTIMKVDAQNNMYVMGTFSGTVDFDPSSGVKNLIATGSSSDSFIAKYNSSGGLVWAESFGGSGTDQPNGLDLDINGNITLTGQFDSQPMDANPGAGVSNLTAAGKDAFIIRLDNNGNFLWAKNISGTGTENGQKIVSDASGNLVAVGQFQSNISIDGAGIALKGTTDGYVVKYDAAGNVIWKFSLGAAGSDNSVISAVTDKNKNTTISGYITGTVNFDPLGPVFNVSGNNSMFIAQYDPSGMLLWVNVILGTVPGANYNINLALDAQNNIYMDGAFSSPVNFGSATPLTPKGTQDIFIAKYNQNGIAQFYKSIGGSGSYINNYGLVVSPDNNLYISGYFTGTIDFDFSAGVANVKDHGTQDMFLAKYDTNGNYKWAFGQGNSCTNNLARAVAVDANNDILLSGSFCSTLNFDASECTSATSTSQGVRDLFIAKYTTVTLIDNNIITPPTITNFCGPSGNPDLITGSTPTGGIGAYKYQWQINDSALGFVDIAGATNKDYDPPLPITVNTSYRRIVSSGTCTTSLASNVIQFNIQAATVTNNTINAPAVSTFCGLGDATVITGSIPAGGSGGYTYQWQKSADNVTFTNIPGVAATGQDYDPTAIGSTTYYRRMVTAGNCAVPGASNVITISVYQPVSNSIIKAPLITTFCGPADPGVIVGNVPTGGDGNFTYKWSSSETNVFTDIQGATDKDYNPPLLTKTTHFFRTTFSACGSSTNGNQVDIIIDSGTPVTNNTIVQQVPDATLCSANADPSNIEGSQPGGGNGTYSYQWQSSTDNVNFTNVTGGGLSQSYDPPAITATTYYRRAVASGNASCALPIYSNVITVNVAASITNNIISQPQPNVPICTSTSADPNLITGTVPVGPGPFTYQWQFSNDNITFNNTGGSTGIGPDYDPPLISKTGYFRRIVTGGACSVASTSNVIMIIITPIPANTITTPVVVTSFCGPGDPALITGSSLTGGSYNAQWQISTDGINFTDLGVTSVSYDPPPITATTHYRRIITAPGCAVTAPSNVITISIYAKTAITNNVIAQPVPDAAFCTANADPAIINGNVPTVNVGTINYQWQKSTDNLNFTDIGVTSLNYDPTPISTTTYYRRLATSGDCTAPVSSNVITITVTPAVTNNVITTQAATFCGPSLAGDITGFSVGNAFTYQWQQSADNITFADITGANGILYNPGVVKISTYYRRVVLGGGCPTPSISNSIQITISTGTLAKVSAGSTICEGSNVTLTASGGTQYSWTPSTGLSATNIAAPVASPLVTTKYTVTVYNGNCSDTANVTIVVIPKPNIDAGEDKIILKGNKVQLAGKVTGSNVQYSWSPTTYLDDPAILNPTATPTETITYTLTATPAQGCAIETDKVTVTVYENVVVPNTFTPNGDGSNDTWDIAAIGSFSGSVVTVYNREGLPIFKSTGYIKAWDGTYNGKLMPFGTYYYVIDLKNGTKPMSGWLAIIK